MYYNRGSNDYKFVEELGRIMNALKAHFKDSFLEQAKTHTTLYHLVTIAYKITVEEIVLAH